MVQYPAFHSSSFFARFLYEEKTKHERIAECLVTEAIIDLPHCYNNEHHRWILNSAAAIIGVRISEFLDRPIFAALSYSPFPPHVRNVLVFEFGSGGLSLPYSRSPARQPPSNRCGLHRSYGCPLGINGEEMEDKFGIEIKESGANSSASTLLAIWRRMLSVPASLRRREPSFLQGKYGVRSLLGFRLGSGHALNLHWLERTSPSAYCKQPRDELIQEHSSENLRLTWQLRAMTKPWMIPYHSHTRCWRKMITVVKPGKGIAFDTMADWQRGWAEMDKVDELKEMEMKQMHFGANCVQQLKERLEFSLVISTQVGIANAEKFCIAFKTAHEKLVHNELSLEAAKRFIGTAHD
ncbi:hypothetical protein HPP92_015106 [Vanilla planifolia]|uniref:Uncharacterized protein n=1 Tax=Vanilla planifolia TaxID=51239 RepID=A0A835UWW6_VANPL|nr:hypothetical protein HPP92_015106 [Vanilla planifolia]